MRLWRHALSILSAMPLRLVRDGFAALLLAILLTGAWPAGPSAAQTSTAAVGAQRTPIPAPAKGQGEACVAPTDWMRRYHMTVLTHQRDKTVHSGDRTGRFDLKGCIACHAVKGSDGQAVTVSDPKHFCRSCHDYAAVAVDCFSCHASRPPPAPQGRSQASSASDVAALQRYLGGAAQ